MIELIKLAWTDMKNIFALIAIAIVLSGCSTLDQNSICGECTAPTRSNGWSGKFMTLSTDTNEIESHAQKLCAPLNGLKAKPHLYNKTPTYDRYSFVCNGFPEPRFATESVNIAPPQQTNNTYIQSPENNKIKLGEAKTKCTELGFKANTEGFGKCVLQLSK